MPTIPTFTASPDVYAAPAPMADIGAFTRPGEAVAQAGQQLGGLGEEWEQRFIEAQRQATGANRVAQGIGALADARLKWSKVPDRQQALAGFDQDAATVRKGLLAGVDDPELASYIGRNFDIEAAQAASQTGVEAFNRQAAQQRGTVEQSLLTYSNLAAAATNDLQRAHYHDLAMQAIQGTVAAGWMNGEEGAQRTIQFNNDVARGRAEQFMLASPNQAATTLADPTTRQQMFPGLTSAEAANLALRAENHAYRTEMIQSRIQAHADFMAERQLRTQQANNEVQLYTDILQGKALDIGQVADMAQRGQLAPGAITTLVDAQARRNAGHDDPMTLLHAQEAAITGTLTPEQVHAAVAAGTLRGSTAADLVRVVAARQQQQANAVERHDYNTLRTEFSAQAIESGIFGGENKDAATDLWAAAQREWTQRVIVGHESSGSVLTDMTSKYAPGKFLGAPPIGGAVTDIPSLNAAAVTTVRMHQGGQLSDAAYQQQVVILNRYRALLALQGGRLPASAGQLRGRPIAAGAAPQPPAPALMTPDQVGNMMSQGVAQGGF